MLYPYRYMWVFIQRGGGRAYLDVREWGGRLSLILDVGVHTERGKLTRLLDVREYTGGRDSPNMMSVFIQGGGLPYHSDTLT